MHSELLKHEPSTSFGVATAVSARKPRVLVAEDDEDMRRLVTGVLRQDGYDVIQAADGIGLLRCIDAATEQGRPPFDAIVSDIQMPDLTALDILGSLTCRDMVTPVIFITAYNDDETRAEARALGALAVIDKPIHWAELRRAIHKAIALRRRGRGDVNVG
jgi:CheY-like chemotaxis protein